MPKAAPSKCEIKNPECYCYIVECSDGTFYTGWTTNLEKRVATHNAGHGSRYTRLRRPVKLVYFEHLPNRSEAMRREIQIKHMPRSAKLKKISDFKHRHLRHAQPQVSQTSTGAEPA